MRAPKFSAVIALTLMPHLDPFATHGCSSDGLGCETGGSGIAISANVLLSLPRGGGPGDGGVRYEYGWATMCANPDPESLDHDVACSPSVAQCAGNPPSAGRGPGVWVYQRMMTAPPSGWTQIGWTCWPELVPGDSSPSMAMIEAAFHRTRFAVPTVNIQPEGDVTLVTLPTHFEVVWPLVGFAPEEIDQVDPGLMFGFDVRIKPVLGDVTYHFGDGTSAGPTMDLGGPYPSGGIVKVYPSAGVFRVRVDARVLGQVSISGSDWIDIPGEASLTGSPVVLTVKTANNRLYQPAG